MLSKKLITVCKIFFLIQLLAPQSFAQEVAPSAVAQATKGLQLRAIGPAVMGGRISHIEISPAKPNTWYVSAGSGSLWKTTNRGITWQAVFDKQASFSIGTVAIDPHNPDIVWVGTGENISGRHVGWGDGIYKSLNGGKSWQHMGLKRSEHIGKILIDPRDSDVIFVAAEGPLWASGGERGVYKSIAGGKSWKLALEIDEHTGVTDIEFEPTNPDILYAAAYQRRRHTWSLLAGGPQSGIYKSTDGGASWRKITTGLPQGDMGKIGLAVTSAAPARVYATIEADDSEKGLYYSHDRGESWSKGASYISGGTGPHYYQELEASPQNPDLIYQMDVFLHVSRDGGKSFDYLTTGRDKHSDNHALWIDPQDGQHLIAGTDGGLYESYDEGRTWRHFPNLPISQFYKVALDNAEPFYNIVAGAQDLGTLLGPSRTLHTEGIRNQDWYVPLGADGYECAVDPTDPNIAYMEYQEGVLFRLDRRSEETLNIQPKAAPGEAPERWNWDSPLLISPHNPKRLYFGSQRLWRSDDRGNAWEAISEDLTTNTNRYELEMMGRVWSADALYDNGAMSKYATLTAISESPLVEGLLYTGSDDGLIHVSEDGGSTWRKSGKLPQVPARSFINDVEASSHEADVIFAAADAHKLGDYTPYLFMSADRGRSWKSITGDLPSQTIVWVIKQDHKDKNLLFAGTEFGLYFSYNLGKNWIKLEGGVPTTPFRDIELHSRDDDLVAATFGRGVYVLDDYTALRTLSQAVAAERNTLFPTRDAWWYIPSTPMQAKGMPGLGTTSFAADNPPVGAVFTYYIQDLQKTAKATRQMQEKALRAENASIAFPGWDQLRAEELESSPQVILLVTDEQGNSIRWLPGESKNGLHRINWDLRLPAPDPINLSTPAFRPPWAGDPQGPLAAPGTYSVELFVLDNGTLVSQGEPQTFVVKPVPNTVVGTDFTAVAAFQQQTSDLIRQISASGRQLSEAKERLRFIAAALPKTPKVTGTHVKHHATLSRQLSELTTRLWGDPILGKFEEPQSPSISGRARGVAYGHWQTRQAPTETFKENLRIAAEAFAEFQQDQDNFLKQLAALEGELEAAGAPYTKGRRGE